MEVALSDLRCIRELVILMGEIAKRNKTSRPSVLADKPVILFTSHSFMFEDASNIFRVI